MNIGADTLILTIAGLVKKCIKDTLIAGLPGYSMETIVEIVSETDLSVLLGIRQPSAATRYVEIKVDPSVPSRWVRA